MAFVFSGPQRVDVKAQVDMVRIARPHGLPQAASWGVDHLSCAMVSSALCQSRNLIPSPTG